ncbi:MAG: bifunctional riboflavin kinase/FAD synthetase [Betaproteobacteria bacterium]|nr:bifunctional riboflavin kinase/FAD synthetase [Betaproteobacteria bacterium]
MRVTRGASGMAALRADGVPAALTIGNFDGVHRAHRAMLDRTVEAAADLALRPTVLTFHPSPKEYFARRAGAAIVPRLSTLTDKLQLFREAGIEHVVIAEFSARLAGLSAEEFVGAILDQRLRTRWLLVGDDFRFGHKRAGTIDLLRAAPAFTVERMHTVLHEGERVSSSAVRAALQAGALDVAAKLLGRPYSITGRVAHGEKLGRTLGFPTANLPLRFTPPLAGICAVKVAGLGDRPRYGVASLGVRPTVNASARPLLEVFLFDFDQPIYGRRICVSFLHKLRDEAKYPDLPSLQAQIRRDADAARAYVEQLESRP